MTAWQEYVLRLIPVAAVAVLYAISKQIERVVDELRRIREALEKRARE